MHNVTRWTQDIDLKDLGLKELGLKELGLKEMGSKQDGGGSNVVSFPGPSSEISVATPARKKSARVRDESLMTAEGLLLMRAFFKIASREDRRKVIALAEALQRSSGRTVKE